MAIPPVQPNDIFSVTIEGDLNGQQAMNVLHYQYRGDASAPHADVMAALQELIESADGVYDDYRDCVSESLTNMFIHYQRIAPVRYARETQIPTERTGTRDLAPFTQTSAVITKQCEQAGRGFVGSLHLPGLSNADAEAGYLAEGYKALCDVLALELTNTADVGPPGAVLVPVLFKRSLPAESPQIVSCYTQDTARVMRRRTVRLGS